MRLRTWAAAAVAAVGAMMFLTGSASATRTSGTPIHRVNVGVEDWQPGPANFVIRFAAPGVAITRIEGWASYSAQPGANAVTGASQEVRQTLVSLTYPGAAAPAGVSFSGLPTSRFEDSLGTNLFDLNLKQTGSETAVVPIDVTFPQPVALPGHTLIVHYDNQTYRVGGNNAAAIQALDTELHFQIFYITVQTPPR